MDYVMANYRSKRFGDKYFVTTDHGSHCILNAKEFSKLKHNKMDRKLLDKLENSEVILNTQNMEEARGLMRKRYNFLFSGASLHIIVVTLRCNMNCIYCHASSRNKKEEGFDMDKATAEKTVDFIMQVPQQDITIEFQGGEPLLNWEVVKHIIEYSQEKAKAFDKNLMLTLVTNMSYMDENKMDYLIDKGVAICTSLDGPKKLHDHNRASSGSNYEQVVKWIKRFNEEYKKRAIENRRINALVTLTKESLKYWKEIIDEYYHLGLRSIHLRFLNKLGVAKKAWSSINYSVDDYLRFWKKSVDYIDKIGNQEFEERMVKIMENKIAKQHDPNYLDLRSPCGAAIGQLAYHHNGDIYTCDEARMIGEDLFLLGNVKKDKYKDIVTSDKACATVAASINDQYVCNDCVYKPYCGICPVCNYAETGSVIGRISESARCKIFKEQFDWVVKERFINKKN